MSAVLEAREPCAQYLETVQPALVQQLGLLATAPGGVSRLRELILTLAVQGMLVPQDPRDEPASVFVERIGSGQAGRSKARAGDSTVDGLSAEEDAPFVLPVGWKWARLGMIFTLQYGAALPEKSRVQGPIPVYGSNGQVGTHCEAFVYAPSLVIGRKGSVGAVNATSGPFWPIDTSYFVTPPDGVHLQFAYWLFRSLRLGKHDKATAIPGISRNDVYAELIALPPTAEQARIVARVEELMCLCDALEAKGRLEAQQHARLLETLLGTLTESTTPEELAANWQPVAEHFDLLLDRPEAVDVLEQTVLQLAVRGLLVPQDPRDECAEDLVRELDELRREQTVSSGLQTKIVSSDDSADQGLFEPPPGWVWECIDRLATVQGGIQKTPLRRPVRNHVPYLRVANVQRDALDLKEIERFEVSPEELERWRLNAGDLLIVEGNGSEHEIGRCAVWPGSIDPCVHQNHLIRVRCPHSTMTQFIQMFLNSPDGKAEMKRLAITTSGLFNLSVGKIRRYAVPVPPVAEQGRIVARVAELRRLCADLRQRLASSQATQSRLAEALVEAATA